MTAEEPKTKTEKTQTSDSDVLPDSDTNSSTKVIQKTTPKHTADDDSGYLLPDSASSSVTASDLEGMSARDLTYARNEIYARHGKVFTHDELNRYFQTKSWYSPDPSFQDTMLSKLEANNASYILQYQKDNGLEYMPGN